MPLTEDKPAYVVEADEPGCTHCGHGAYWTVVETATDTAIGRSFSDREIADDLADDMNAAFAAGQSAERSACEAIANSLDEDCAKAIAAAIRLRSGENAAA